MRKRPVEQARPPTLPTSADIPVPPGKVRIATYKAVPELLQEHGVDAGPLLAEFGLTLADFEESERTFPFATMSAIIRRCVEQTGCQYFGLIAGERLRTSALGVLGFLMQSAPDVRTALSVLSCHIHLHNPGVAVGLVEHQEFALLRYDIVQAGIEAHEQILDAAMAVEQKIMRSLCGQDWRPTQVRFAHSRPKDVAKFREVFQTDLYFDAAETALVFARHWLDKVPLAADPVLYKMMAQRVSELTLVAGDGVVAQLRRLLPHLVTTRSASLATAAKALGLSPRTLSRRFDEEGVSFTQLRDEVCYALACQLLESTRMPAGEVGALLGYANLSAFTRAFTRWSGMGPSQWRAAHGKRSRGAGHDGG